MKPFLTKRLVDFVILTTAFLLHVFCISIATAEIRTIAATGEYRMGDNDTRTDAKRLALLDAKRLALEQAGVYIESITEVKNLDLAKEEIRAYTAGIVEVIEQATRTMMEGETTVVRVDVKTKIDTDVVTRQIEAMRQSEDLKGKLIEARFRAWNLQQELEAKTRELAAAKSRTVAEAVTRQRQKLLTQADVENLVSRARVVLTGLKGNTLLVGSSTPESRKYARALIEQALSYEPENTETQGLLGFVQFEEGQRETAISTFRDITKKEPLSAHAHMNLGKVLQASGAWVAAIKEYETARNLEPDHAGAHAALGKSLRVAASLVGGEEKVTAEERNKLRQVRQKLVERAVESLREAIRLAPRNATYHRELGEMLYSLAHFTYSARNIDEGLAELRGAVTLDPADAAAHKALAERLVGEEEIAEYRAAVRLDPGDIDTRIDLGTLLLLNKKDINGAITEFQAAIRIDPKHERAHLRLGEAFEELGQMDKAIEEYRKSVDLGPAPSSRLGPALSYRVSVLSDALTKAGKRKEAGQVIHDYLKLEPDGGPSGEEFFRKRLQELNRE